MTYIILGDEYHMYGNNLGMPFMMPSTSYMRMAPNIAPMTNNLRSLSGLTSATTSPIRGLLSGAKNIGWSGMLNNVSKTLGVVKEAIPIVKEVKPMMNNMRSMLKIASAFNDATTTEVTQTNTKTIKETTDNNISSSNQNSPNFFL